MGKIIGGILGTLAIAGLVLFLLFHFGVLSFGKGDGNGDVKTEHYKPKFHHVYTIPSFHIMLNFFYFTSSIYTIKSRLRQGVRGDGRGSKPV